METRFYQTRDLDLQGIAHALVLEYQAQGFEAQQFGDINQVIIQLKKLGCCWLLFVILFPLGLMNIAVMALVTALIFAEKLLPIGRQISQGIALTPSIPLARDLFQGSIKGI